METIDEMSFIGLVGYILFLVSELMALSKLKSNGVLQFLSRRVQWLGGKKIRVEIGIQSASSDNSSIGEEERLFEEEERLLEEVVY